MSITLRAARGLTATLVAGLGALVLVGASGPPATAAGVTARVTAVASAATPAYGTVWVLNAGSITGYAPGANGNIAPSVTIRGHRARIGNSADLAVTRAGALWVTNAAANLLRQYAPGATGNVAGALTIRGAKTRLSNPIACALDRAGHLWVLNDKPSAGTASINEYAAAAHGNVAPIARIAGSRTRLFPASGIAVAPGGQRLWVTHVEAGSGLAAPAIQEFATSQPGNVAALAQISGRLTTLDYPGGVSVDASGAVIVANDPDRGKVSAILTFASTAHGNVAPTRSISGATTGVARPGYLALDASGDVWVPNPTGSAVRRFRGAAPGDVPPVRLIRGPLTTLKQPRAVAVFVVPPTAPRAVMVVHPSARVLTVSWQRPVTSGGGLIGYTVGIRTSRHGPWRTRLLGRARSYTTAPLRRHTRYWVRLAARNEAGTSPQTPPSATDTR